MWFWMKFLNNGWMDCCEICHTRSCSRQDDFGDHLTFFTAIIRSNSDLSALVLNQITQKLMLWQRHDGVWRKIRWFLSITVRQQIRIFTLNLNRFKLTHLWLFWRQEYQMCCITHRFSLLRGSRCKGNLCNITSKQKEMFERNWKKNIIHLAIM